MIDARIAKSAETRTTEELTVSSQRTFPASSFPRKYVLGVIDNLHDAAQTIEALQSMGYYAEDILFMTSWDFLHACAEGEQQSAGFSQSLLHVFNDRSFEDTYQREARQGRHFLAVRPSGYEQIRGVSTLLASHHAHVIKYIDTWTSADLLP